MAGSEASPVLTPRYSQILGASVEIARTMQHSYVGVEHLFLAIIQDRDAVPTQSLAQQIDLAEVEAHLLEIMDSPGYNTPSRRAYGGPDLNPVLLTNPIGWPGQHRLHLRRSALARRVHAGLARHTRSRPGQFR